MRSCPCGPPGWRGGQVNRCVVWPPGGHGKRREAARRRGRPGMATKKQVTAAKRNVKKAQAGAKQKRSIASMPAKTRSALGKQGAAVAQRKRTGGSSPKTRQELYDIAKRKNLPGRSKMGRTNWPGRSTTSRAAEGRSSALLGRRLAALAA